MPELPSSSASPDSQVIKPSGAKTADEINDLFNEVDKETPLEQPKKEAKVKEPKEEKEELETKDDDELELKEEDDEIEKLDLAKEDDLEIDAPPRKKEILKEYPELFKKFPFLEKMMYRDKQITELFGSFDDAKEIAEKSETFNNFENQLLSGSTEEILRSVKEADDKAFNLIVDDYLPTLAKVDKDAYFHVVSNLNKRLIMEMVEEAKVTNNDDLTAAAAIVQQFIFGTSKFTPPARRVEKAEDPKQSETERERLEFVKERFETARDDLQTRVDNTLRATIDSYIDPKGVMSSYVKKNAISDAMNILSRSIASDSGTVKNLDKLWRAAFEDKFSKESLGKIEAYYKSKAKINLKAAILKARAEALKDTSPRATHEKDDETQAEPERQRRLPTGRPSQQRGQNSGPKKGESVTDFFMRD